MQAKWLDGHLEERHLASQKDAGSQQAKEDRLDVVAISIRVEYHQLLRRITGRRSCPTCGRIYNIYFQPPKHDTLCDVEGTPLVQRGG